MNSDNQMQIIG